MLGLDFENASLQSNQDQAAVSQDDSLQSCSILQGSLSPGELGLISGPGGARESAFLPQCPGNANVDEPGPHFGKLCSCPLLYTNRSYRMWRRFAHRFNSFHLQSFRCQ